MKTALFIFFIFGLSLFLRFYKLGSVPPGLNQDESAIGYNAYSILETGRDEHYVRFPLYFKSFGDYKLPLYIYLAAVSIKIWGLTEYAVRFPSALLGSVSVIILYLLVYRISENKKIAFLSAIFLAINPWHLHFSRAAFEVNVALFFVLFSTWMLLKAANSKHKLEYLVLSVIGSALSLYSYNVTRLLSPLLFALFVLYYRDKFNNIPKSNVLIISAFTLFFLSPFFASFFTPSGIVSARGALITSADVAAKNLEFRSYVVQLPDVIERLFFNKWITLAWYYFNNLIASLSTNFFFLTGSAHGNQGIGNIGMFYLFQFPLCIFGIIDVLLKRKDRFFLFVIWAVASIMVMSLSKEVPHATRGYFLSIPVLVFSAIGFIQVVDFVRKFRRPVKIIAFSLGAWLIIFNISYYFFSYYYRFPILYAKAWRTGDKDLSLFLKNNEYKYSKIIFDTRLGFMYSSLLFYAAYPPKEFQETVVREDDAEGFSIVKSFGKYIFRNISWQEDIRENDALIITNRDNRLSSIIPDRVFDYPERPIVLSDKEQIINYPYTENAYEIVNSGRAVP